MTKQDAAKQANDKLDLADTLEERGCAGDTARIALLRGEAADIAATAGLEAETYGFFAAGVFMYRP